MKMKSVIRLIATPYSIVFGVLLIASFGTLGETPYQPFLVLLLCSPVILNWISYFKWGQHESMIRPIALVVALFYGLILLAIFITALVRGEYGVFLGLLFFGPPVVVNYFVYRYWPSRESA